MNVHYRKASSTAPRWKLRPVFSHREVWAETGMLLERSHFRGFGTNCKTMLVPVVQPNEVRAPTRLLPAWKRHDPSACLQFLGPGSPRR